MNRVLGAARLHLVHPLAALGVPWAVVASSFAINLLVWGFTDAGQQPGGGITGGLGALYATALVVFVQSVTQLLPFAMGVGLSRRAFYLGSALFAAGLSLAYGIILTVLERLEAATGGWGVGLHFWAPGRFDVGNPFLQVLVFAGPMLFSAAVGIAIGVLFKRWGPTGLYSLAVASVLAIGLLLFAVTWRHGWDDLGHRLTSDSMALLAVGYPVLAAVVVGLLAFAGIRRVVP